MGKRVQLNLYVSEKARDALQKIAALRMLVNPKKRWSAIKVATEIIVKYLELRKEKANEESNNREGGLR